ncbi:MAG: CHAT domain-containing protein [Deltaproteobacteria bacterium]|nr:CHAT domain-containing protein [Deltaproteobacteria bacterium]
MAGEIKEALASYEEQAREAEKNAAASLFPQPHLKVAALAYKEAARAARASGQLQKGIVFGEKALEIAEKLGEPGYKLEALDVLIPAYRSIRSFSKASNLVEKGFKVIDELPASSINRVFWEGRLHLFVGGDFLREQQYEKAILAYTNSLRLQEAYLTEMYTRTRRDDASMKAHQTAVLAARSKLGDSYHRSGRLEEALEQYRLALVLIKKWNLRSPVERELYHDIGEIYLESQMFSEALEYFRRALALAESQRRPDAIIETSGRIGTVLHQSGKPDEAIAYFQRAIHLVESTRSVLQSEEYRQSYFGGPHLRIYVNLTRSFLQLGRPDEAFNYNERARSRVFLDVLGSKVQLSRLKSGLLEEERALNERIAGLKARLQGGEEEEADRAGLRKELREAEQAYNAFLARVRKQDKEQLSLMTVEPLTVKEIQELLDPGTTLIEYFVTQRDILVWVIEKDTMQYLRVQLSREQLAGLVRTLRETIFTLDERDKFRVASTTLYDYLIHPLLPHVGGKELIIVPHDVLHYLPFHALLAADGRYLIEKYPIYYLSSASLLQFTQEKRKAKGEKVLAFGNPDLGDPKMELKFAETEAREIATLYPQSTVLVKKEATEEKGKTLSPQHDILHFATHAELKEEDPLSSAVLLAKEDKEDGRLEVKEIFGMDLKANLVVLSACETGLGKLSTGDEIVGLTRAFIYAGTPSVVASLWKVEDSSTAALMASFYKNLRTMSKVEALRQAQLELIRGQTSSDLLARRGVGGIGKLGEVPEAKLQSPTPIPASISTSHPYFWAPFILVGDGK